MIALILLQSTVPEAGGTPVFGVPWDQILMGSTGLTAFLLWDNITLRRERKALTEESREMAKKALEALAAAGRDRT